MPPSRSLSAAAGAPGKHEKLEQCGDSRHASSKGCRYVAMSPGDKEGTEGFSGLKGMRWIQLTTVQLRPCTNAVICIETAIRQRGVAALTVKHHTLKGHIQAARRDKTKRTCEAASPHRTACCRCAWMPFWPILRLSEGWLRSMPLRACACALHRRLTPRAHASRLRRLLIVLIVKVAPSALLALCPLLCV